MQDGQKTIKDLFDSSAIFNIPKYQRAYAWEKEQLDAFVEDLENQDTNKDKDHSSAQFCFRNRHQRANLR